MTLGLIAGTASAQEAVVREALSTDAANADSVGAIEGYGYAITPGVVTHPSIGVLGGATDNVFYQSNAEGKNASGLLRLAGGLFVATDRIAPPEEGEEVTPRAYEYRAGLQAAYTEYLSGNDSITSQRSLSLNAAGDVTVNPGGVVAFIVRDHFVRDIRPPNFEDDTSLNRDDNTLTLGLRFQPYGRNVSATLHYDNWIEIFEGGLPSNYANRMNHTIGLSGEWQWRPFTKLLADFSYGFYGALGDSTLAGMPFKTSSQPLRATVGLSTLLTTATTFKAHAGYTQASYGVGEGYMAPIGGVEFGYRWTDTGRIVAMYDYDHFDSLNANFYADHAISLHAIQQISSLVLDVGPQLILRHFGGVPAALGNTERDDVVFDVRARAQWVFNEKYSLSADYRYSEVHTDYVAHVFSDNGMITGNDNPSFARNEFMLGFRAAY